MYFGTVDVYLNFQFLMNIGGRKPVPLQRVMILEVSQYLENYLWPNFSPETASFEHVMSMILMVNEKVRIVLSIHLFSYCCDGYFEWHKHVH